MKNYSKSGDKEGFAQQKEEYMHLIRLYPAADAYLKFAKAARKRRRDINQSSVTDQQKKDLLKKMDEIEYRRAVAFKRMYVKANNLGAEITRP